MGYQENNWTLSRKLYLTNAILLTLKAIPILWMFLTINISFEGSFNVFSFIYNIAGLVISIILLSVVKKDQASSTGAVIALIAYSIAFIPIILFYIWGRNTSLYYDGFSGGQMVWFSFGMIFSFIGWILTVIATIMSYVTAFQSSENASVYKNTTNYGPGPVVGGMSGNTNGTTYQQQNYQQQSYQQQNFQPIEGKSPEIAKMTIRDGSVKQQQVPTTQDRPVVQQTPTTAKQTLQTEQIPTPVQQTGQTVQTQQPPTVSQATQMGEKPLATTTSGTPTTPITPLSARATSGQVAITATPSITPTQTEQTVQTQQTPTVSQAIQTVTPEPMGTQEPVTSNEPVVANTPVEVPVEETPFIDTDTNAAENTTENVAENPEGTTTHNLGKTDEHLLVRVEQDEQLTSIADFAEMAADEVLIDEEVTEVIPIVVPPVGDEDDYVFQITKDMLKSIPKKMEDDEA